jgi:hypothetical protein
MDPLNFNLSSDTLVLGRKDVQIACYWLKNKTNVVFVLGSVFVSDMLYSCGSHARPFAKTSWF